METVTKILDHMFEWLLTTISLAALVGLASLLYWVYKSGKRGKK